MENNKKHQITFLKGRIGFFSLDVLDQGETKYQIRSPNELTTAIFATDERYNACFLLHSTIPVRSNDEFLQIEYGKEASIIQQPNSIGDCFSADANMSRGFADFLSHHIPGLRPTCKKARLSKGQLLSFWDYLNRRHIYNLVTKDKFSDKLDLSTLLPTLKAMKSHASVYGISTVAIPMIGCGLDKMNLQDVVKLLRDGFAYSDIHIVVYTLESHGVHALSSRGDPDFYAEDETDRYSEEFHLNEKDLETDFTRCSNSCKRISDEQFPALRGKEGNDGQVEFFLQKQPK